MSIPLKTASRLYQGFVAGAGVVGAGWGAIEGVRSEYTSMKGSLNVCPTIDKKIIEVARSVFVGSGQAFLGGFAGGITGAAIAAASPLVLPCFVGCEIMDRLGARRQA